MAGIGKRPVVQGFGLGEADEGVLRQVGNGLGCAVAGEIIGRGNEFQTALDSDFKCNTSVSVV